MSRRLKERRAIDPEDHHDDDPNEYETDWPVASVPTSHACPIVDSSHEQPRA